MTALPTICLLPRKEESVKRFHPWIFSGAIASITGKPVEGYLVQVLSSTLEMLGVGHYEKGSIAVRMLSFDADTVVDARFWEERLAAAFRLRQALGLIRYDDSVSRNTVYRLVHGEGDGLPGLIVDVYGHTAVLQAHSVGMHRVRTELAQAIVAASSGSIRTVYYKSDSTLPFKAGLESADGFLIGSGQAEAEHENGLLFLPDWIKGQKTGFFIDQRENRSLLEKYAAGRRVLNMFCYSGGFSLYAMRGGAAVVHSVDSSARAIHMLEKNMELNYAGDSRHESQTTDAFRFLDSMEAGAYDLIVLDPPAFAKHRKVLRNALIGYRKLNAVAIRKIAPGGVLFTFSCSQAVSREEFRLAVFTAAASAGRKVRILHQLTQPADHPINIYHPEGEYLKGLVLYVE
ncbi:class I SAM-dependent rRNA methyltransferase [Porphyromonas loveana]|uniref:SAM-dependent methyltransferase n=2 Tax=Porphyromonas loveana TaxID=1884669 RepID=A0A2U1FCC4_9PORP|nr:class I SAM-dependent rRNA methyltransferase [Porphyromonas loveana]PVZ09853.1 SAM-dependent methyltransferase [Porphyromonas loveana]